MHKKAMKNIKLSSRDNVIYNMMQDPDNSFMN